LRNGAVAYQQTEPQTFASLLIKSNGWLTAPPSGQGTAGIVSLSVNGNATVQSGGGIVSDNQGSGPGVGLGAGHSYSSSPYYPCGGGGYGGYGAAGNSSQAGGGVPYSSISLPTSLGSGGGTYGGFSLGGSGGGSIQLTVTGILDDSGEISANGGNGSELGGGGGSGGSILLSAGTLTGGGSITANGGNGANAVGGGGGGGRIAITATQNSYSGQLSAIGGGGYAIGGAGTIYSTANRQTPAQVLVDNGGRTGTNTPFSSVLGTPASPFNLTIQNGAIVTPQTAQAGIPQLNYLTVGSNGLLTSLPGLSTLDLFVLDSVDIEPGGVIAVDGLGYAQGAGAGAGPASGASGGGAGYGGMGGASSTGPGGVSYGSLAQPADFGSGGGFGSGSSFGGSAGGGAIQLNVGGVLNVDGKLSAEGQAGLQNNSGGGSGGSIWATAGVLAGEGRIAADGGAGQVYGGGGAGGRIALCSAIDIFDGNASVSGGAGDYAGGLGTLFTGGLPSLQIISNTPFGIVTNSVSSVILYFNDAPNPFSMNASSVYLTTPYGVLSPISTTVTMLSPTSYQVGFPAQTALGLYTVTASASVTDFYGQPISQANSGTFSISLPVIQGIITDGSGNPLPGVLIQPSAGLSPTSTDTNGNYSLGFVPGSTFTVTPSLGGYVFSPASMSYNNATATVVNQNYTGQSLTPSLSAGINAGNFALNWMGVSGVSYQVYYSSNLTAWQPYGGVLTGNNAPLQVLVPTSNSPSLYFSVQASY